MRLPWPHGPLPLLCRCRRGAIGIKFEMKDDHNDDNNNGNNIYIYRTVISLMMTIIEVVMAVRIVSAASEKPSMTCQARNQRSRQGAARERWQEGRQARGQVRWVWGFGV